MSTPNLWLKTTTVILLSLKVSVGQALEKGSAGWFWLGISPVSAIRWQLELEGERGDLKQLGDDQACLSPSSLRASPYGLSRSVSIKKKTTDSKWSHVCYGPTAVRLHTLTAVSTQLPTPCNLLWGKL